MKMRIGTVILNLYCKCTRKFRSPCVGEVRELLSCFVSESTVQVFAQVSEDLTK